jgi:hypothetical protein
VGTIWQVIKNVFGWAWQNKNAAAYIVLAIVIAWLTWRNNNLSKANQKLEIEKKGLPENIEFIGELKANKFKLTYRDSKGATIYKEYYIPSEGGVKFVKYVDLRKYDANSGFSGQASGVLPKIPSLNPIDNLLGGLFGKKDSDKKDGEIDPVIDRMGFTFRPGIAALYDGGFNPSRPITVGVDAKLVYISRFSAGLGTTIDYPYIWVSRHVDDIIPFIPVNNLELNIGYGKPYSNFSTSVFAIGGRTNF